MRQVYPSIAVYMIYKYYALLHLSNESYSNSSGAQRTISEKSCPERDGLWITFSAFLIRLSFSAILYWSALHSTANGNMVTGCRKLPFSLLEQWIRLVDQGSSVFTGHRTISPYSLKRPLLSLPDAFSAECTQKLRGSDMQLTSLSMLPSAWTIMRIFFSLSKNKFFQSFYCDAGSLFLSSGIVLTILEALPCMQYVYIQNKN